MFDDYDHQMMLHGLGLEDKTICDSLVAFHKDFKRLIGGAHNMKLVNCNVIFGFLQTSGRTQYFLISENQGFIFGFVFLGSVLDVLHAASLTKQLLQRGSDSLSAVITSLKQVYVRNQVSERNKQVSSSYLRRCCNEFFSIDSLDRKM